MWSCGNRCGQLQACPQPRKSVQFHIVTYLFDWVFAPTRPTIFTVTVARKHGRKTGRVGAAAIKQTASDRPAGASLYAPPACCCATGQCISGAEWITGSECITGAEGRHSTVAERVSSFARPARKGDPAKPNLNPMGSRQPEPDGFSIMPPIEAAGSGVRQTCSASAPNESNDAEGNTSGNSRS